MCLGHPKPGLSRAPMGPHGIDPSHSVEKTTQKIDSGSKPRFRIDLYLFCKEVRPAARPVDWVVGYLLSLESKSTRFVMRAGP